MQRKTETVGRVVHRWVEHGEGTPVVLIHGVPTSPELWRHVLPRLEGVRAMAWEMIGYGASIPEGRLRDLSVRRQAEHLADLMERLGLERAVLAGHDLGGGVAQIVAVRRPELCAGLFLTNAIGYDAWPVPSVKAMRAAGPLVRRLPGPALALVLRSFYRLGHDDPAKAREAFQAHWPHYARPDGAEAFYRQIRALNVRDTLEIADALPTLGVPARIVWGAADPFLKVRYGERFARDLRAPLRRIEGGKHFTPEDHPDVVAEELLRLVADVRSA